MTLKDPEDRADLPRREEDIMVHVRRSIGRLLFVEVAGSVVVADVVRLQQDLATTCLRLGERPLVLLDLREAGFADVATSEVFRTVVESLPRPVRVVILPGAPGTLGCSVAAAWVGDPLRRVAFDEDGLSAALHGAARPAEFGRALDVFPRRAAA